MGLLVYKNLQEIKRLVEHKSAADVLVKVCRRQYPRGKDSLMNSMSVVTPNRSEMKHYGGNNITMGVATIPGQCISSTCWLAHSSVLWWEDLLWQGPVQQEVIYTSQATRGENEGSKVREKNQIWIKTFSQERVIMINGCVFQHNAMMKKFWIWDYECMKLWVTSITMQSMGSVKLLLISPQIYTPSTPLLPLFSNSFWEINVMGIWSL